MHCILFNLTLKFVLMHRQTKRLTDRLRAAITEKWFQVQFFDDCVIFKWSQEKEYVICNVLPDKIGIMPEPIFCVEHSYIALNGLVSNF